jgi:hypothetical protein
VTYRVPLTRGDLGRLNAAFPKSDGRQSCALSAWPCVVPVFAVVLSLCCSGGDVRTRPASEAVLTELREHFMHQEAVGWLTSVSNRSQLRTDLERAGYQFVGGVEQHGEHEVDGFSRSLVVNGLALPATVLVFRYAPGAQQLVGVNVLQLDPQRQQDAKTLLGSSLALIDAPSGRLHFLGVQRLAPNQLLKMMIRVDPPPRDDICSVMYVLAAE